jgi:hypothetical protein
MSPREKEGRHDGMLTEELDNTFGGFEELFGVHAFGGIDISIRTGNSMEVSGGGHYGEEVKKR